MPGCWASRRCSEVYNYVAMKMHSTHIKGGIWLSKRPKILISFLAFNFLRKIFSSGKHKSTKLHTLAMFSQSLILLLCCSVSINLWLIIIHFQKMSSSSTRKMSAILIKLMTGGAGSGKIIKIRGYQHSSRLC